METDEEDIFMNKKKASIEQTKLRDVVLFPFIADYVLHNTKNNKITVVGSSDI